MTPDSPFLDEASFKHAARDDEKPFRDEVSSDSGVRDAHEGVLAELEQTLFAEEEAGVINGDNRVRITDTTGVPWRWICKITITNARGSVVSGGTGVLVSNRHVLTAAHVVHEAYENMQNFSIEVTPALNYGDEPFGSYSVSAKPKLRRNYRRNAADSLDWDYALLTLATRVGQKTFKKLNGQSLCFWGSPDCGANSVFARPDPATLNGKAVFTAGYPSSAGGKKLWCAAGILVGVVATRRTMRITADTTHGQSGSPVWIVDGDRKCLVGIAAGAGKYLNVVVRVTRELVRQVRTWITEDGDTPSMIETEEELESAAIELQQTVPEAEEDTETEETETQEDAEPERDAESWDDAEFEEDTEREEDAESDQDAESEEDADSGIEPSRAEEEQPREDQGDERELSAEADEDTFDLEMDFEHIGVFEHDTGPAGGTGSAASSATLGFEFDLNHGFEAKVATAKGLSPPSGFRWPSEGISATDHEWKDPATGDWKDAIHVSMDAVRMEIATAPFHIADDAEFDRVVKGVVQFGSELAKAKKTRDPNLDVPGVKGHPTTFGHPRTVVNKPERDGAGLIKFPGDADHATYKLSPVPLVIHRVSGEYPTATALWASPQATITLPLSAFGALVWEIHKTKGGAAGVAFTGRDSDRLGLRDDLAWTAVTRAVADRKKKIGKDLSDGTKVTEADFTKSITALVTILVMYMLTSVMKDDRDEKREQFAKGSLPLNIKTPLWQIHKFALTDRERFIFRELYGEAAARANLYALAQPGAGIDAGSTALFPDYTRWDPERFFTSAPTWQTLVEAVIDEKKMLVARDNRLPKKKHLKGDEILIAPLSSKITWDKTDPRIAVEMRRLGFAPVAFDKWRELMRRIRALAVKINA